MTQGCAALALGYEAFWDLTLKGRQSAGFRARTKRRFHPEREALWGQHSATVPTVANARQHPNRQGTIWPNRARRRADQDDTARRTLSRPTVESHDFSTVRVLSFETIVRISADDRENGGERSETPRKRSKFPAEVVEVTVRQRIVEYLLDDVLKVVQGPDGL